MITNCATGKTGTIVPREPEFVLRARDPLAMDLVRLWAALGDRDYIAAIKIFDDVVAVSSFHPKKDPDAIQSAVRCAQAMDFWARCKHRCRDCGCTDASACETPSGACHWVEPDLCSDCANTASLNAAIQRLGVAAGGAGDG